MLRHSLKNQTAPAGLESRRRRLPPIFQITDKRHKIKDINAFRK
jgi:hypothetical protein